ncbi:hypothetical protein BT96DRAFT_659605 [Gymnopus androsaceus JB14]|uniref:Uncharacterized protein n=1 Tax=Gymnopus androsaceus JB14 TaxID=1447944 RepID=A0A6A4HT51_9AGAR|nr:hypothetical protein BT96DRAFT_659605 [Gymnopus androsaceus JB14]
MSTGMVKLAATSTGTHRLQIVLPSPSSNLASSSSFDVANLDTTGPEQFDHESGENSSSGSDGNSSDTDSATDDNSSDGDSPSDSGSSKHSTSLSTKSTSQTSSSVLSSTEPHASIPSSQPTFDSINLQTVNVVSTTSTSSSTFTSLSLTTASSTQMYQTSDTPSSSKAIILSVIFATILSILLLLAAAILICRRRRRRLNSTASADPSESSTIAQQWYNSSRFKWDLQGSAPGDSATPSGTVWDTGTLSYFSTLAPSDSVSRFVSTKNTTTRWHDLKLGYRGGLFEKISASGTGSTGANMESEKNHHGTTAVDGMHVGDLVPVVRLLQLPPRTLLQSRN